LAIRRLSGASNVYRYDWLRLEYVLNLSLDIEQTIYDGQWQASETCSIISLR
jgi:hypothetical protein